MSFPTLSLSGNTLATQPSTSSHPQTMADEADCNMRWLDDGGKHPLYYSPDASPVSSLASVNTYTSTVPSQEDLAGYPAEDYYQTAPPQLDSYSDIAAATSKEFAQLFPSSRRLHIGHDDSTEDGNMNLRVNTTVSPSNSRPRDLQLFHLRLHDLRSRDFSFRRYSRDSNREICHSSRKVQRPRPDKRPSLQRSLSNALNLLRPASSHKNQPPTLGIPRNDSGYDSMGEELDAQLEAPVAPPSQPLDEAISLEFSNYAQCVLRRRGAARKHYDFSYWGHDYSWQRIVHDDGPSRHVSFRLSRRKGNETIAHIVTASLSEEQAQQETEKGGWIPPCSMWISDQATIDGPADVCDAVIATGLIALVDDSIRRRFHSKSVKQLVVPLAKLSTGAPNPDYVEPQGLVHRTFGGAPE